MPKLFLHPDSSDTDAPIRLEADDGSELARADTWTAPVFPDGMAADPAAFADDDMVGPDEQAARGGALAETLTEPVVAALVASEGPVELFATGSARSEHWSLLHHKAKFVFARRPLIRNRVMAESPATPIRWPLRVLIIVGSEDTDEDIAIPPELDCLSDLLDQVPEPTRSGQPGRGDIAVRVLSMPSSTEAESVMAKFRPDVLHIVGHGQSDQIMVGTQPWTSVFIANTLLDAHAPRIVVLNTCRGAADSPQFGLVDTFLECGVEAVVAHRGKMLGIAGPPFIEAVWTGLKAGQSLAEAVAGGRYALFHSHSDRRYWALPSLTVRNSASLERLDFPPRTLAEDAVGRIRSCTLLQEADAVFERFDARWQAWVESRKPLLLLEPESSGCGATSLLELLLERLRLDGHAVRYVDGGRNDTDDWLRWVHRVRRVGIDIPKRGELNKPWFVHLDALDAAIGAVSQPDFQKGALPSDAPVPPNAEWLHAMEPELNDDANDPEVIRQVRARLRDAMKACAEREADDGKSLFVGLDHFGASMEAHHGVLSWLTTGFSDTRVRFVVVGQRAWFGPLASRIPVVPVGRLSPDENRRILRVLLRRHGDPALWARPEIEATLATPKTGPVKFTRSLFDYVRDTSSPENP